MDIVLASQMISNSAGVEGRSAVDLAPVEEVYFVSGGKEVGSEQVAMSLYCAPRSRACLYSQL